MKPSAKLIRTIHFILTGASGVCMVIGICGFTAMLFARHREWVLLAGIFGAGLITGVTALGVMIIIGWRHKGETSNETASTLSRSR